VEDAVHALEYLAHRPEVDGCRIGIYGTSFGGGVAVLAALRSGRPRAAAVTVPVTSGDRWLRSIMRWHDYVRLKERAMEAIAKKAATGEFQMVDRFEIMVPDPITSARYPDKVLITLETMYHVINHDPLAEAHRMRTPTLVMGVQGDLLSPVEQATELYERLAGPKELHLFETGTHFSVYDELLPAVASRAVAWFDCHVRPRTLTPEVDR
jgi:dipeptidyl aminopeptidase/acylaminoacyl peptidase